MSRIYLSPPHMGGEEQGFVNEAFDTNWLSTVGPNLNHFEEEMGTYLGGRHAVALASGTSALHLSVRLLGIGQGDEVIVPTLTFVASVNPVVYENATPVFVDAEESSWNLDPNIVEDVLKKRANAGKQVKAIMVVHLYGQPCDMDPLWELSDRFGVPLIEDAAEGLGATYKGRKAGALAPLAALSFNGNKIITTTGGGMLITERKEDADKVRFWSTQAREPGIAYHHKEVGYNYRMSNVLAGIGRGQLRVLDKRVERRREIAFTYRDAFADLPMHLMPQPEDRLHTNWLSVFTLDGGASQRNIIIDGLHTLDIESRPAWKPMHQQPLFEGVECVGGKVADRVFDTGICLPSGSSLSESQQNRVIEGVRSCFTKKDLNAGASVATDRGI